MFSPRVQELARRIFEAVRSRTMRHMAILRIRILANDLCIPCGKTLAWKGRWRTSRALAAALVKAADALTGTSDQDATRKVHDLTRMLVAVLCP